MDCSCETYYTCDLHREIYKLEDEIFNLKQSLEELENKFEEFLNSQTNKE